MALTIHDTSLPNDGNGDELRTAFENQNTMNTELYSTKVDKVTGKGLSENDFTNALKAKLDSIATGAEVNVQSDFHQTDNTAPDYIKNKPDTFYSGVGYFHYNDVATSTTPLVVLPTIPKKLTNDTLGAYTNVDERPYGVSANLWDGTLNQFDFSSLSIGDMVQLRVDLLVTTTSANQNVSIYAKFGVGTANEYDLLISHSLVKTITTDLQVVESCIFSIDNTDWRDFPAELYILSDDDATVQVNGWYIPIIKKAANILSIEAIDETATHFKGNYNISTNSPFLSDSTGVLGDEYICTVAGTRDFGSGIVTVGVDDVLAFNGTVWYLKVNNNQSTGGGSLRTFTCYFGINQNVAASPTGNTQWYRKDAAQGNNVTSSFTLQTSLDVTTTFATHSVLGACHTLPFQAKIKSVHARGWTNTTNSTGVDFVVLKSKETGPNIASGVTTISNGLIIARETVQIYASGFPNGFVKEFASGSLTTTTLPNGSDIRLVFKNFNLASNMFDTIITVEFEEVV